MDHPVALDSRARERIRALAEAMERPLSREDLDRLRALRAAEEARILAESSPGAVR